MKKTKCCDFEFNKDDNNLIWGGCQNCGRSAPKQTIQKRSEIRQDKAVAFFRKEMEEINGKPIQTILEESIKEDGLLITMEWIFNMGFLHGHNESSMKRRSS